MDSICLSVSPSVFLSVCLSFFPMCLSVLSFCLSICLYFRLSISISVFFHMSVSPSHDTVYLYVCLPACLSACLPARLSIPLSVTELLFSLECAKGICWLEMGPLNLCTWYGALLENLTDDAIA